MQIVGFGGLAKAGKTTAAKILAQWAFNHSYHVVMEQFAGPLKKASSVLGFHKGGDMDAQYRRFCQIVGTDLVRNEFKLDGWWVKLMADRIDVLAMEEQNRMRFEADGKFPGIAEAPFHETLVIIDDVRFPNECEVLKKYKARSVFVCAHGRLTDLEAPWRQHESEQLAWDYTAGRIEDNTFDFTVPNNKHSAVDIVDDGGTETRLEKYPALEAYIVNLAPTLASMDATERIHE